MKCEYFIGYPPAFLGYGKFTKKAPTVNLCSMCDGFADLKIYFEKDGYAAVEKICPKHYNEQVAAQLGEQLVAA